jgi:hypothetical protein
MAYTPPAINNLNFDLQVYTPPVINGLNFDANGNNLYWVGGPGNWSDDDNHWATSSGGAAANGNIPTSDNDVFIDANSGFGAGGTITIDEFGYECNDFTVSTTHDITLTNEPLFIYGSTSLNSGFIAQSILVFYATTSETITFNNATYEADEFNFRGTGSWTLQDDITVNDFYIENGTFDANDHNIVADTYSFYAYEGVLPVINMGSGTWEATGGGQVWKVEEDMGFSVTINRENSTIKLTNIDSEPKFFLGDGKTYNNLWIVGSNVAKYWIVDSNTFNDLKINPGNEISFSDISTTTLSTLTAVGTADDPITIDSFDYDDDGLGQHTLSKSSGTVNTYYLDISNSNATGGATWIAYNSTDTTNNDGWLFVTNASVTTTVQTLTSSLLDPTIIIGASAIVITNASSLISSIIEPKIYINYPWTTGSHDKSNWTDVSTPSTNYSPSSSVSTNFSNQATTSTNFSNTNHKSIDWT